MKIGILSDSHGNLERLRRAMDLLSENEVEAIVHCGDLVDPESLGILAQSQAEAYAVAGNMDKQTQPLAEAAERAGVHFSPAAVEVPIGDGAHLVAVHGDEEDRLDEYIRGRQFRYVCHGHTHRTRDEAYDWARVINPGALHKPKDPRHPTCAVLDTQTDSVAFLDVSA